MFIPKYRNPVLRGDVGLKLRDLIREICRSNDIEILKGHVRPDHVHLLLDIPPHLAPAECGGRRSIRSLRAHPVTAQPAQLSQTIARLAGASRGLRSARGADADLDARALLGHAADAN